MSEIEEVYYDEMHLMTMHRKAEMSKVATAMGEMLMGTGKFVNEKGIETAGQPLTVYHEWDATHVVMDVGHPITAKHNGEGEIKYTIIPKSKALKIVHYGDYAELHLSHGKVFKYMKDNGIEPAGSPWEQYITDPKEQTDKSKWQTDIYHPIK